MAKLSMQNIPVWAKVIIAVLPAIIISALLIFLIIMPKKEEIEALDKKIGEQQKKIAEAESKAAKLADLMRENKILLARINELKKLLPEEKEITDLLKQVSDLGISAGLEIKSWKPRARTMHSSGIVYEIPVGVNVTGSYHDLGMFLGSLTRLARIVNVKNMALQNPKVVKGVASLNVTFVAATFTAVPEDQIQKAKTKKKKKKKKR
jgi:type IV pilus assembly protein PilO